MPIGPFGEILGTTGTLEGLGDAAANYKSKVIAPRNPKLIKGEKPTFKVTEYGFASNVTSVTSVSFAHFVDKQGCFTLVFKYKYKYVLFTDETISVHVPSEHEY